MEPAVECTTLGCSQPTPPFLNLDDEDAPGSQTASLNSQFFAKRSVIALLLAR